MASAFSVSFRVKLRPCGFHHPPFQQPTPLLLENQKTAHEISAANTLVKLHFHLYMKTYKLQTNIGRHRKDLCFLNNAFTSQLLFNITIITNM